MSSESALQRFKRLFVETVINNETVENIPMSDGDVKLGINNIEDIINELGINISVEDFVQEYLLKNVDLKEGKDNNSFKAVFVAALLMSIMILYASIPSITTGQGRFDLKNNKEYRMVKDLPPIQKVKLLSFYFAKFFKGMSKEEVRKLTKEEIYSLAKKYLNSYRY